jgi:iron complex outermembrane receptor protein
MPVSNLKFWLLWAAVMQAQDHSHDLIRQNIEDLMNVEVTTASKKEQKLSETAAAIYVITQEDIRRSGATSIAEALRMVPGVNVARLNSSQWAISARGFNGRFSDKLLVLMDGRSVYSPRFSGVYWDVQDTMLEDIERIEVIRGPGATLWGANAVNGVINIITRHTKDTQGTLVSSGGGSDERGFGAARLGGKLGDKAHYRVYGKYFDRGQSADRLNGDAGDGWSALRGGFRVDSAPSSRDTLTLQGDTYHQEQSTVSPVTILTPPYVEQTHDRTRLGGGNVLGRWNRAFSNGSETTLQMYWDRTGRETDIFNERTDTLDLDFDHHTPLGGRQDVVWGLGYRWIGLHARGGFPVSFNPVVRADQLFSAFVQDEIGLVPDRFKLTVGSKLERNDYTGVEWQPSLRLLWTPDTRHSLWAAASRAVHTPSPGNTDLRVNASAFRGADGTVNVVAILGNPDFRSEKVFAYELGYRIQEGHKLSLDLASFYNHYDDLRATHAGVPFFESTPLPAHRVIPSQFDNQGKGNAYGLEAVANWNATSYWKWSGGYTWLRLRLTPVGGSFDSPAHQWQARSSLNLPRRLEFDTALYYNDAVQQGRIPSYLRLDARLGWRPSPPVDLSVVLQNLLDDRHPEFNTTQGGVTTTQIRRGVYAKLTWQF